MKGFDFEDNAKQTNGRQDNDNESDSENDVDFVGSDDDIATAAPSTSARPSIAELRANLQAQSKASSTAGDTANGDDSVIDVEGSSAGKEALLAERKRQAELREKRRKNTKARIRKEKEEGTSTFKGQQKESMSALPEASSKPSKMSDIKKQLKKEGKRQFFNFDTEGEQAKADAASSTASALSVPTSHTESAIVPQASTSAAAAIPSNSIAFSSLDFKSSSALNEVDAPKLSKKQRDMLSKNSKLGVTSHNPTVALSALNKREEFLSKLTPEARERAEEKDKWERMAMRAEGTKVYDDEAKLKKMLKKKEKSKDKSRKDWYVCIIYRCNFFEVLLTPFSV